MRIRLDGWAWAPRTEFTTEQIESLRSHLTVTLRGDDDAPAKVIQLYRELPDWFGVPREYYLPKRKSHHVIDDHTTAGNMVGWPGKLTFNPARTLKPEQAEALDMTKRYFALGPRGGIVRAAPGWGKTVYTCSVIAEENAPTLVLVHKEFLKNQWRERLEEYLPGVKIGTVQGDTCDYEGKHVVLGMVQSLSSRRYDREFYKHFGLIVSDESLGYDSRVLTERGYRKIGELVESSEPVRVVAYDTKRQVFTLRAVTRRWVHRPRSPMLRIVHERGVLECTANHPVLTSRGYVEAGRLVGGVDTVVHFADEHARRLVQAADDVGGRLHVGGRRADTESVGAGAISGAPRDWAGGSSGGEVRGVETVGADSAANRDQRWLWDRGACIHDAVSGRSRCALSTILPGREEAPCSGSDRGVLVPRVDGVVGHGRWQPLESSTAPACRGVRSARCAACGGLDANTCGMAGVVDEVADVPGADILDGVFACGGGVRAPARDRVAALQGRPDFGTAAASSVRVVWGSDTDGGGQVWEQEVLPSGRVPAGGTRRGLGALPAEFRRTAPVVYDAIVRGVWSRDQRPYVATGLFGAVSSGTGHSSGADAALRGGEGDVDGDPISSRILSVAAVETPEQVYDLSVGEHYNFVVEGVVVHNCHRIGAYEWSPVPGMFPARHRLGITATPRRKDGAENVFRYHIGQEIFAAKQESLPFKARFLYSEFYLVKTTSYNGTAGRAVTINYLTQNETRNRLIAHDMAKALAAGRKLLVVSERLEHLKLMDAALRETLATASAPIPSIGYFVGGKSEEQLDKAAACQVIFATTQLVLEGLDIPALDTLFLTTPLTDIEQAIGRIRRPCEGKKPPVVVDVRDDRVPMCRSSATARLAYYQRMNALSS